MTTELVNLDAKRKAKEPKCAICGEAIHDFVGQCKRVIAITEESDGSTTYHLRPLEEPDVAG